MDALSLNQHVTGVFSTPVFRYQWPADQIDNEALKQTILKAEAAGKEDPKDIIGGWSSTKDLFNWPGPEIQSFSRCVLRMANGVMATVSPGASGDLNRGWQMEAWANVSREGHYHNTHSHPNSAWSGVYYVSAGVPDTRRQFNGMIEFLDPRAGVDSYAYPGSPFMVRSLIAPVSGLMIVFPSWLKHMVHPFHGQGERISIAFNVAPII